MLGDAFYLASTEELQDCWDIYDVPLVANKKRGVNGQNVVMRLNPNRA